MSYINNMCQCDDVAITKKMLLYKKSGTRTTSVNIMTLAVFVTLALWCQLLSGATGFAIMEKKSSSSSLSSGDPSGYDAELVRKVILLSRLLKARKIRLPSGMFTAFPASEDSAGMIARKRGPTSCINNCLTGGMSFVRCKSMCHW